MKKKKPKNFSDFTNVKNIHDDLIPEEFPEGPFGSPIHTNQPVSGKSSPWESGQRRQSAYIYSDKAIHNDLPRQTPGAHHLHDQPDDGENDEK